MDNYNYINDIEFLKKLDNHSFKEVFVRIISLDKDENQIEEITGKATGGSISVDGASSVRRTCSISLVAKDVNINDYYWSLNTKFKLYIGLRNLIEPKYPDIIWFKQGTYVITSFNTSLSTNSYTINISGKDKMCLLNGEVGGSLTALSYDFNKIIEYSDSNRKEFTLNYFKIKDIIFNSVMQLGGERLENIIINDLDEDGLELLEYKGTNDAYLIFDYGQNANLYLGDDTIVYYDGGQTTLKEIENNPNLHFDNRILLDMAEDSPLATKFYTTSDMDEEHACTICKIKYGQTVGYRITDLTYPGELTGQVNENICTACLDKIKDMLGEYEYFYNVDGQFVFQKKKTYINTSWNNIRHYDDEYFALAAADVSEHSYYFGDGKLITSFQNTPNLANVRNDFSVWGKRSSSSGIEAPVHMRYAIDEKPTVYINYEGQKYTSEEYDWRELIYQMQKDYFKHHLEDDFIYNIASNNKEYDENGVLIEDHYPTGYTGYEQYYIDIEGFWRQLYNPNLNQFNPTLKEEVSKEGISYIKNSDNSYTFTILNSYKDDVTFSLGIVNLNPGRYKIAGIKEDNDDIEIQIRKKTTSLSLKEEASIENHTLKILNSKANFVNNSLSIIINDEEWVGSGGIITAFSSSLGTEIDIEEQGTYEILFIIKGQDQTQDKEPLDEPIKISIKPMITTNLKATIQDFEAYSEQKQNNFDPITHWSLDVTENPETLNFWFDFLDADIDADITKYSVKNIGCRPKAENNDRVKAIYFRETPYIIFVNSDIDEDIVEDWKKQKQGYSFVNIDGNVEPLFSMSSQGISAKDEIDNMLYQNTYAFESISVAALPVYYLIPNTRIFIQDDNSGIYGDYILSKYTIPLTYNGTMSITANKVVKRLY